MIGIAALCLIAPAAAAEPGDDRDYCPARPGIGIPACTIAPGHVAVETGLVDWSRDDTALSREDTLLLGDTMVRWGVADTIELQAEWVPFGHGYERDRPSGAIMRADRVGDVTLGAKVNLSHPDGSDFSAAVQPFVTLPVGRPPIGASGWGSGVIVPVTYDVSDAVNLELTPEIDRIADEGGRGHHIAFSGTAGVAVTIGEHLTGTVEVQAARDDDPAGHATSWLSGLSLGWRPRDAIQFDAGANLGLDRDAPDAELYIGVSRLF